MCPEGGFRIRSVSAYIASDSDDDEGVMAFQGPGGVMMPMIGADEQRIRELRPVAEGLARRLGQRVKLVRFSQREDVETIDPGAASRN